MCYDTMKHMRENAAYPRMNIYDTTTRVRIVEEGREARELEHLALEGAKTLVRPAGFLNTYNIMILNHTDKLPDLCTM